MRIKHLQLKRAVTAVLLVLLLSAMGLTNAMAQSFTVGSFNYSINEDGTTVTLISHVDGQNATGTLTIPTSVIYNAHNYPVTVIGSSAFDGCSGLTGNLYIGNQVETIGDYAFYGCSGFTGDLHLGNNVTTVGGYAFYGCTGFSGDLIIDHELASVGTSAFYNCSNLTGTSSVVLTGTIGGSAFSNCSGITSVTIGDAVTTIPSRAFFGCSNLTTVTIGEGVTTVAGYSFWNCPSITTVNFNATDCTSMNTYVTSIWGNRRYSVFHINNNDNGPTSIVTLNIGENVTRLPLAAFKNSPNMTGIYFAGSVAQWCGITFESNPLEEGHNLYINGALVTALTIPQGVTAISDKAFYGCSCITSLNISNSVTSIGANAFYNCTGMVSATIPNSVTDIGSSAFYGCSSLTSITIPNSVTTISSSVFHGCSSLTSITIPNSVTDIGYNAFYGCSSLTSITIPNSVTTISSSVFYGCSSLTSITIPNSVTTIEYSAFGGCSGLSSVTLGNSIDSIATQAFYNCSGLTAVYYSGSIAQWCEITFGSENSNPLYYGHNLYINGVLVTDVTIPEGTTVVPNHVFCGGTCINTVNIPSSVTSFGTSAFYNCSGIAVHYSGTIAQWCGITFANNGSNPLKDGALYIDGTLVTNLVIPYGVTVINPYAFYCCTGFTGSLTLPNSLYTVGHHAFCGCSGFIGSLTIPNSVVYIEANAFNACSGFTGSLTLGTNLYSMSDYSFQDCTGFTTMNYNATNCYYQGNSIVNFPPFANLASLTKLNIGSNVQAIRNVGYLCTLTSINVAAETPPTIADNYFSCVSDIPVRVPCGSLSAYQNATGWSVFTNLHDACDLLTYSINEDGVSVTVTGHLDGTSATGTLNIPITKTIDGITYTVTRIGNNAFNGCSGLMGDLIIPNSVTAIGNSAFYNCSGFTGSLTIGNSVASIGNSAFRNCTGFTGSLVIPDSVTSIGTYAFLNCSGFTGNLIIGNSVTTIGALAFACQYGGNYSGSLVIPNSVTTIGNSAFMNCSGLTGNLDIPSSITSMSGPFSGCSGFTSITLHWDIPISGCSVGNVNYDIPLIVPCGSTSLYQYNPNWRNFSDIQEDCSGVYLVSATASPSDGGNVIFRAEGESLLSDSFEEYTVGNTIATEAVAAGHDWWTTWDSNPGGEKDGHVAEYDGSQCGHFVYGNDQVLLLGDKESGIYDLEFDILVPDGKNAFFSILHQFDNGSANEAVKFHLHVTNSHDPSITPGQGVVTVGFSNIVSYIPCVYDAWMHFRVQIDIDADLARFYYTNSGEEELFLCQWQWSLGNQSGDGTLAAIDFWPPKNAETSEYYVDNISLKQLGDGTSKGYDANIQIVSEEASNERGAVRTSKYFAPGSTCTLTAIPDENYVFTNWTKDGEEVSTEAVYSFIVTEDASFMANFEQSSITQEIFLSQGWNWFSTNVDITLDELKTALVEVLPNTAITIQSQTQNTTYNPNNHRWNGRLTTLDITQMYMITVATAGEITLEGLPLNPTEHPITITNGANWIAFPLSGSMTVTNAFAGFAVTGDVIQSQTQNANYRNGRWMGQLSTLEPGQGYIYKSSVQTNRIFTFPTVAK